MVESLFLLLCLSAYTDLRQKIIPNWVCALVYAISATYALTHGASLLWAVIALPLLTFAILFATYHLGIMGGGDVKLLVALMPSIGYAQISHFALNTILFGGLVALAVLINAKIYLAKQANDADNPLTVPYGVAIAAGAFTVEPILSRILYYVGIFF